MSASVYVKVFYGIRVKATDLLEATVETKRLDCHPNDPSDKFCSECGNELNVEEHTVRAKVPCFDEVPHYLKDEYVSNIKPNYIAEWLDYGGAGELDFEYADKVMFLGKQLLKTDDVMYGLDDYYPIRADEKRLESIRKTLDDNGLDGSEAKLYCLPQVLI